jgi:hypothetical protein
VQNSIYQKHEYRERKDAPSHDLYHADAQAMSVTHPSIPCCELWVMEYWIQIVGGGQNRRRQRQPQDGGTDATSPPPLVPSRNNQNEQDGKFKQQMVGPFERSNRVRAVIV